jgi:hypothetical protein
MHLLSAAVQKPILRWIFVGVVLMHDVKTGFCRDLNDLTNAL